MNECAKPHFEAVDLGRVDANSLVIIRGIPVPMPAGEMIALGKYFPKGTLIWLAQEGETLEVVSEEQMNAAGWYRKDG